MAHQEEMTWIAVGSTSPVFTPSANRLSSTDKSILSVPHILSESHLTRRLRIRQQSLLRETGLHLRNECIEKSFMNDSGVCLDTLFIALYFQ